MSPARLLLLAPFALVFYFHSEIFHPDTTRAILSHYILQFSFLLPATASLALAATLSADKRLRGFWSALAFGCGIWTLTALLELLEALLDQPAYGTVADGFWVAGYIAILVGLAKGTGIFEGWSSSRSLQLGFTWLLLALTAGFLGWFYAMPNQPRLLVIVLGFFYHISDILLVFLALIACEGAAAEKYRLPLRYIALALFVFYFVNLIVILKDISHPIDRWAGIGFCVGYYLMYLSGRKAAVIQML